jgi:hypothetical protein
MGSKSKHTRTVTNGGNFLQWVKRNDESLISSTTLIETHSFMNDILKYSEKPNYHAALHQGKDPPERQEAIWQ